MAALEAVPEQRGAREARKVSRRRRGRMVALPPAFGAVAAIENFYRSRVTDTTGRLVLALGKS